MTTLSQKRSTRRGTQRHGVHGEGQKQIKNKILKQVFFFCFLLFSVDTVTLYPLRVDPLLTFLLSFS